MPEPGATSRLPAWWGADDWLLDVSTTVLAHRDTCADHHVAPDTVVAVARGLAAYADHRTGRDCRPTNARLVEVLRLSLSTVQRARRALKALGFVVELVRGRSILSRAERLAAWRRGSSHRQVAAEFALCSRRGPRSVDRAEVAGPLEMGGASASTPVHKAAGQPAQSVDGDTPPGSKGLATSARSRSSFFSSRTETSEEERAPRAAPTSRKRRRAAAHPAARRLAEGVRGRLWWLRAVSAARITPTLHRLALAGWTPRDVDLAVRDAMATRGWKVIPRELTQPAAYLATLLRDVDPADRPGAWEDHQRQLQRAEDAYRLQLVHGAPCPHGQPAGHVPSPLRGLLACPACRRESTGARSGDWPA